jgi:hypothetical protein
MAITGLILAVLLPPAGLVLSIIAFFRTGPGKLRGHGLTVAAIITAIVVGAGATFTYVALHNRSYPTDPGCRALQHPDVKFTPATDGPDFQGFVDIFNSAADQSQRTDVRNALRTMADDYKYLQQGVSAGARPAGPTPDFESDLKRVQQLCALPVTVHVP